MTEPWPQQREMADESMVRNLTAQAEAIWPQEAPLYARYRLPAQARIIDVGCGTGEISARLLELFPAAQLLGLDLEEPHLEKARARCAQFGERVKFQQGDAYALPCADGEFDLVVNRHVLQAVSDPRRALEEMVRVLKPGGWLHLINEDYGMLYCHPTKRDADVFWREGAFAYGEAVGCDLRVGRKSFTLLTELGLSAITADYLTVDTIRVPRETFARIWEAWRDGYSESLAQHSRFSRAEVDERWAEMIAAVRDPKGYALWFVPVWSAKKP